MTGEEKRWEKLYTLYTLYHSITDGAIRVSVTNVYHSKPGNRIQSMEYALSCHGIDPHPVAEPLPMDDQEYNEALMAQDIYHDLQTR